MTDELRNFLSGYIKLQHSDLDEISNKFKKIVIKKNDFLLQEGEICKDVAFVQTGCLRLYYVADGLEISVWFSFKNSSAIEINSFISGRPSMYFIQAIKDSEVYCLSKPALNKLYANVPGMQEMMRKFWEDAVINILERFTSLQKTSAEHRYAALLKKPGYLQTIPQKYLASFIGITPTSLSRLRKKAGKIH